MSHKVPAPDEGAQGTCARLTLTRRLDDLETRILICCGEMAELTGTLRTAIEPGFPPPSELREAALEAAAAVFASLAQARSLLGEAREAANEAGVD